MNNIEIYNKYLKNLFDIFIKRDFETVINTCLSYNIKLGDYNKDITSVSKKVFNEIINVLSNSKIKLSYKDYKDSYRINAVFKEKNHFFPSIVLDIPVFLDNYEKITLLLIEYMLSNKINFNIKLRKKYKNSILEIKIDSYDEANRVIDFFGSDPVICEEIKSRVTPILFQKNLIGIYSEYKPYSFKNYFFVNLIEYFKLINNIDDINIETLIDFFDKKYKNEKHLNKKRMNLLLYKLLLSIKGELDIKDVFTYDSNLDLGSFNVSLFDMKLSEDGLLYFKNKEDNSIISYGSEDYLNIIYSKFYENIIKKEKNEVYYSYFYSIFNKILSNNYYDYCSLLSFEDFNYDYNYHYMIIVSSLFFAYRKLNFSLKNVYIMLDNIMKLVLNIKIDNSSIKKNTSSNFKFPFEIEYGNKVVNTFDGEKITIKEYFKKYKVLDYIPLDSIIHMKDGKTINSNDFFMDIEKNIPVYKNFENMLNDLVEIVEFK